MTILPAQAGRPVVLLLKSKKIAHQAGYYLLNGRWHKTSHEKPAPHGAPVVAAKPANGDTAMTADMWSQLYAHPDNSNKATYTKKLDKLKAAYEAGDAKAILAGSYPNDTTNKKVVKIANYLLGLMGSTHTVAPGLKQDTHHALSEPHPAPEPAPEPKAVEPEPPPAPEPKAEAAPAAAEPAPAKAAQGTVTQEMWDQLYSHPDNSNKALFVKKLDKLKAAYEAGDVNAILSGSYPNDTTNKKVAKVANFLLGEMGSEHQVAPGQKAGTHAALSQAPTEVSAPEPAPAAEPEPTPAPAEPAVPPAPGPALAMPAFVEGKTTNGVVSYYEGQAQKILDMAATGDVAGLVAMKEDGLKPNGKGKVSNTWAGKTANSKLLLALHAASLQQADGEVAPATSPATPEKVAETKAKGALTKQIRSAIAEAKDEGDDVTLKYFIKEYAEGTPVHELAKETLADLEANGPAPAPAADEGPKDGDTKPGANGGTLVFKDGRWHKQDEPAAEAAPEPAKPELSVAEQAAKITAYLTSKGTDSVEHAEGKALFDALTVEQQHAITLAAINSEAKAAAEAGAVHPVDAVPMPELSWQYPSHETKVKAALAKLKEQIKAEGVSALKGVTKTMSASGKLITKLPGEYGPLKVIGNLDAPGLPGSKVHAYVEALKEAAGGKKATKKAQPAPVATAAPHADQNAIQSMDNWKQVGPQGGSNPGGKFVDEHGTEWYCKFPGNEDVAKSEVLAAKLYGAAGVAGQDAKLVTKDGKLGIASKWQDVKKASSPAALAKVEGVASGFAADAWLGNWDVVGLGYDNLQVGADGKAMRVDAGGSLEYRAQGGKKAFGNTVTELDSLRDPKINPQSAAVFGKLSKADITAGVAKVLKVSDAQIHALVNTYGPGDAEHKKKLAETLIARKADLLAKFPKAKKEKKVTFKPEKISEPPSFLNWGGSGKDGPSSKPFLNQANEKAVQAIYEAAKTGSVDAVKNLTAETYNKATGEVVGAAPVLEHPSQHVKGYAQQAVNEINYQMNPPKRFRFEGGHPLHSLNAAYPSHKGPPHSDAVEKAGKFLVLGEPGTISLATLDLPKVTYASGQLTKATYSPAAKAAISAMPETQKQAIQTYTGSSYKGMNNSLWSGNPSGAAKSAGEALHALSHDITPGTVLSRKLTVHGEGLDQILKSTGKVLQEPAIMSTSIRPSSWSGNVQLKLHVGPGVKGLWVGPGSLGGNSALSVNAGEDELILPPNTRLLILSVKKSGGSDADGFGGGVQHLIEAVVLPTQQAS